MTRPWDQANPPDESELARENRILRAHVMNLLGKLERFDNEIPQVAIDLASQFKLEMVPMEYGHKVQIKMSRRHDMGS